MGRAGSSACVGCGSTPPGTDASSGSETRCRTSCPTSFAVWSHPSTSKPTPARRPHELPRRVEAQPLEADPGRAPRALGDCRRMLEAVAGPLRISSGPTFLVAPDVRYTTDAEIVRSVEPKKIAPLRDLNPGNWTAEEWPALLAGTLGPWATAMVDGRVASICPTPRPIGR